MSIISFEPIDGAFEPTHFKGEGKERLEFRLPSDVEGFIRMGGISRALNYGMASFELRLQPDGILSPELITEGKIYKLPRLRKQGFDILPIYPSIEEFHELSARERALRQRVCELDETVRGLCDRVYGQSLFDFPAIDYTKERNLK